MIESRNDLILRILDEIAFLAARMTGLKAMGMHEEILKEVERLEASAEPLGEPDKQKVRAALDSIRTFP